MELTSVALDTQPSITHPGMQEAILIPIGDIQLGPKLTGQKRATHVRRLKQVVQWGVDHGAYFHGMGDFSDVASPSNRDALLAARLYDTVRETLENGAEETLEELQDILAPTVGSWTGLQEGHHYWPFEDGTTTDTRMADFLGCRFLGTQSIVTCRLPAEGQHKTPIWKFSAWHGEGGGGATLNGAFNKLERTASTREVDAAFMGHFHQAGARKTARLISMGGERGGEPRLRHKDILLAVTGSFMRSYLQGSKRNGRAGGSYAEKAGMSPASLGLVAALIRPEMDSDGYVSVQSDFMSL